MNGRILGWFTYNKRHLSPRRWISATATDLGRPGSPVAGVYVLYFRGEVVYVGRGFDVRGRIVNHGRRFKFDRIKLCRVSDEYQQKLLERKLIYRLRPMCNQTIPTRFVSSTAIYARGV